MVIQNLGVLASRLNSLMTRLRPKLDKYSTVKKHKLAILDAISNL
jgi:hypothetical protein